MVNSWRALRTMNVLVLRAHLYDTGIQANAAIINGTPPVIILDWHLTRRARHVALTHELVHLERGINTPADKREEHHVDREVARRLINPQELDEWIQHQCDNHIPVTIQTTLERFDWVTPEIAAIALQQAADRGLNRKTGRPTPT